MEEAAENIVVCLFRSSERFFLDPMFRTFCSPDKWIYFHELFDLITLDIFKLKLKACLAKLFGLS